MSAMTPEPPQEPRALADLLDDWLADGGRTDRTIVQVRDALDLMAHNALAERPDDPDGGRWFADRVDVYETMPCGCRGDQPSHTCTFAERPAEDDGRPTLPWALDRIADLSEQLNRARALAEPDPNLVAEIESVLRRILGARLDRGECFWLRQDGEDGDDELSTWHVTDLARHLAALAERPAEPDPAAEQIVRVQGEIERALDECGAGQEVSADALYCIALAAIEIAGRAVGAERDRIRSELVKLRSRSDVVPEFALDVAIVAVDAKESQR